MKTFLVLVLINVVFSAYVPSANVEDRNSRIVGGQEAEDGAYPYIVALKDDINYFFCGGSIINSRTILTAAECISGRRIPDVFVVVGTNTLASGGTKYQSSHFIIHPKFDSRTRANDIGLVITIDDIEFSARVQPIALEYEDVEDGVSMTLAGWGSQTTPNGPRPNQLQQINLQSLGNCSGSNFIGMTVYNSSLCTMNKEGEGICLGDYGGSLVKDNKIVGVASWTFTIGCAQGEPDVFARISYFASWIDANKIMECEQVSHENERNSRIVGGQDAEDGAYPYMVALRNNGGLSTCGGAIITSRTVLTAAHCLNGVTVSYIQIYFGSNTLNSGGITYRLSHLISHHEFKEYTLENDIALMITIDPIEFNSKVQPIGLGYEEVGGGVNLTLTGWGRLSHPNGDKPNKLQVINLKSISLEECKSYRDESVIVTNASLCTLNKEGEGACFGDSGGPLVEGNKLVGLTSWAMVPCAQGKPDVFTRISSYISWINKNKVVDEC